MKEPSSITRELNKIQSHLNALFRLFQTYPDLICSESAISYFSHQDVPTYYLRDAVCAGKHLTTEGWTREVGNTGFNWTKTVLGVKVIILDAESIESSPVSPKAFPLALEDSSPSAPPVLVEDETKTEEEPDLF